MTDCGAEHPESMHHQHDHARGPDVHGHGVTASSDGRYLVIALGLIVGFLVFEVVMAFVGRSLALLADAGHMSDVMANPVPRGTAADLISG